MAIFDIIAILLTLTALFKNPPETVVMIRRKELLDALERTVDRCSAMMTVLRAVLIKNA